MSEARPSRLVAAIVAGLLVVAACAGASEGPASSTQGPTAVPTATARSTPRPTPVPTSRPTAKPTASPSPTPEPEAAAAVRIGAPYELVANPANKELNATISISMGGRQITEIITGREIKRGGTTVGTLLVLEFTGVPMNQAAFEAGATGLAKRSGGKLTYATILGWRAAFVTSKAATFGLTLLHRNIVVVAGTRAADTRPLLTSVIKANKR
jgi:hypothetical protein